jgi:hypothetical protein
MAWPGAAVDFQLLGKQQQPNWPSEAIGRAAVSFPGEQEAGNRAEVAMAANAIPMLCWPHALARL